MATLAARPPPLDIDLGRTALMVVDMQNAFASKGGMFDLAGFDISGAAPVIEVNRRLVEAARQARLEVVYLQMSFKPDSSDGGGPASPNYRKELGLRMMRQRPELRSNEPELRSNEKGRGRLSQPRPRFAPPYAALATMAPSELGGVPDTIAASALGQGIIAQDIRPRSSRLRHPVSR
jgi:nicotinamidase-related amidase